MSALATVLLESGVAVSGSDMKDSAGLIALRTLGARIAVGIATFFQFRRVYSEWIVTPLGKAILAVWGIRMALHRSDPFPRTQTVYISNHTSTIDMFVLIALGLPSCRFFLSGYLRRLIPNAFNVRVAAHPLRFRVSSTVTCTWRCSSPGSCP